MKVQDKAFKGQEELDLSLPSSAVTESKEQDSLFMWLSV